MSNLAANSITEICNTTGSIDLHQKLGLYEEARVQEYLVVVVKKKQIRWHRLVKGKYNLLTPDGDGVYRSRVFPGLWLDSNALFNDDMAKVLATLQNGIDSDEHQPFVAERTKRKRSAKKRAGDQSLKRKRRIRYNVSLTLQALLAAG